MAAIAGTWIQAKSAAARCAKGAIMRIRTTLKSFLMLAGPHPRSRYARRATAFGLAARLRRAAWNPLAISLLVFGVSATAVVSGFSRTSTEPTPAEQKIAAARARIERMPSKADGHNELAMALSRRARETADPAFYTQAAAAIAESRRVAPGNLDADKIEVWLLLGQHEFSRALDKARAINKRVPDDLMTYGMIVDACVELGRYAEAEEAAQWMLNMRPGTVPGLTRAAYLRELFGDIEGSLELMRMALDQVQPRELEERAWILTQMSHLELVAGRVDRAQSAADHALQLFPGYHYALGALAKVYERKGDHAREAALLAERYRTAPHPENLFAWAQALAHAGQTTEAQARFAQFEPMARAEMTRADNANRELALYYIDHANRIPEAVSLMASEIARRRDVTTLDTYAWALHKAGRRDEAKRYSAEALAVGTLEPTIREHAQTVAGR
jgi:tetratricopeptide (TPR) repeat protein